jgi:hypothetical protein
MQDYLGHVAAYRASGKTAAQCATEHGVPLRSMASWCAHPWRWKARLIALEHRGGQVERLLLLGSTDRYLP